MTGLIHKGHIDCDTPKQFEEIVITAEDIAMMNVKGKKIRLEVKEII